MKTHINFTKKNLMKICAAAAAVCVFAAAVSVPQKANADSLSDRYAELQKQQQSVQSQLDAQNSKLKTEAQKKAALVSSINLIIQQTSILNSQIASTNAQIDAKNREIAATQADIEKNYTLYKQQLRAMYESGDASYVNVLLSSGSFTDFLKRAEVLKVLSEHNNEIIDKLNQDKANLNTQQTALKASQTSLESSKAALASKQAAVAAQIAQQAAIVSSLSADVSSTQAQQDAIDSELNKIAEQQAAARRASLGGVTGSSSGVVNLALSKQGCSYVWCAAGPSSFDCSGFTMYVYANAAGIYLPHNAAEQYSYGRHVSKSELQPGDLVFFNTYGGISHVGIYIGGGNFIGAQSSRTGVAIASVNDSYYWGPRYVGACRLI